MLDSQNNPTSRRTICDVSLSIFVLILATTIHAQSSSDDTIDKLKEKQIYDWFPENCRHLKINLKICID